MKASLKAIKGATGPLIEAFAIMFLSIFLFSCARGYLRTMPAVEAEVSGQFNRFSVILYRSGNLDGIEALAILDVEGDAYEFILAAPKFDYAVMKGLKAEEALAEAKAFVAEHRAFHSFRISAIKDEAGGLIGYEVRPLYLPFVYGLSDIMDVGYRLKEGGKVRVRIYLKEEVGRVLSDGSKGRGLFKFQPGGGRL